MGTSSIKGVIDCAEEVNHEISLIISLDAGSYEIQFWETLSTFPPEKTEKIGHQLLLQRLAAR
jgi:hypothetical protein